MKRAIWLAAAACPGAVVAAEVVPMWAFAIRDAAMTTPPAPPPSDEMVGVPDSTRQYALAQVRDLKNPPDWFPQEHGPLPPAVAKGGEGPAFACGSCHLMSGMGRPESSSLAGQPAAYLERQMADFRSGARGNHLLVDGKPMADTVNVMVGLARAWSPAEAKAATDFYAALKPVPWVKVVETDSVPRTHVNFGYMRVAAKDAEMEPLGQRIVELPQDTERAFRRDPRSGDIAYVPKGAIARGRALAVAGAAPCAACHGADLRGAGEIPGIAGRSPTYTFRQLYFFQHGGRGGAQAAMMSGAVDGLSQGDMIDLSAYLASLPI